MRQFKWSAAFVSAWFTLVTSLDISTLSPRAVNYTELAQRLSGTASIYLPGSQDFEDVVSRWSNLSVPVADIVVVPSTEEDVVKIVSSQVVVNSKEPSLLIVRLSGHLRQRALSAFPCHQRVPWICHHLRQDDPRH